MASNAPGWEQDRHMILGVGLGLHGVSPPLRADSISVGFAAIRLPNYFLLKSADVIVRVAMKARALAELLQRPRIEVLELEGEPAPMIARKGDDRARQGGQAQQQEHGRANEVGRRRHERPTLARAKRSTSLIPSRRFCASGAARGGDPGPSRNQASAVSAFLRMRLGAAASRAASGVGEASTGAPSAPPASRPRAPRPSFLAISERAAL